MVERSTPLSMDATIALMRGMHFGVEHGYLDPSPHNEAGAGYFVCGPPGAEQRTLCQVSALSLICMGTLVCTGGDTMWKQQDPESWGHLSESTARPSSLNVGIRCMVGILPLNQGIEY
jgi:hypothetical protein